jgi:hypothetical protein
VPRFHCYASAYESVYRSDVDASTPQEAAAKAAEEHEVNGRWTVVPGVPVQVDVTAHTWYESAPAGPEP